MPKLSWVLSKLMFVALGTLVTLPAFASGGGQASGRAGVLPEPLSIPGVDSREGMVAQSAEDLLGPQGQTPRPRGSVRLPSVVDDPAEQIAPPGLNIRPGNDPITAYMAIAMRQELDNLAGRFESALLSAEAATQPVDLRVATPEPLLTASREPAVLGLRPDLEMHPVLRETRQLIREWPELIERRAYGEARQRWLAARQSLWENFPTDRPYAQPEIRAIWLDRGSIVRAGSQERLAVIFDQLEAAGINTVFVETVNAGYPIYPSRIAPSQNPLTRRWDPLQAAVELAHERDMQVHAWIWVFAVGNQLHNAILNLPLDYPGPVLNAYPTWAGYDNRGNTIPAGQTKPFLDASNPQARGYLMRLIEEIITQYDVDGLQLDYIRYPFQDPGADRTYGYGVAARHQFQAIAGVDPFTLTPRIDRLLLPDAQRRQRDLWDRWTAFRVQQVTSFVSETSQRVRQKRPDIILSTAVFATPEHERLQKIQQDWGDWAQKGLVDWVILMSYAQDTNRFEQLIQPWVVANDYSPTLIIPGIRLLNLPVAAAIDQIQALRDLPAPGYALFAVDNLNPSYRQVLGTTQGVHKQRIPQVDPFATAAERYQVLQQEWNLLMANGQLWIDPVLLEAWVQEVNSLSRDLDGLAAAPSTAKVAAARAKLAGLRQRVGVGMSIQTATTRDYRIRTWQNRLTTVDRLLAYGDARL
jgi:uncharacterized lipoprotein YddW (UPF0748 family)